MLTLNLIKYKGFYENSSIFPVRSGGIPAFGCYYSIGYIPLEVTAETPAEARTMMSMTYSDTKEEYGFTLRFGRTFQWLLPDGQEIESPNGFYDNHRKFNDDHPEWGFCDGKDLNGYAELMARDGINWVPSAEIQAKAYQKMKTKNAKKFGFVYKV